MTTDVGQNRFGGGFLIEFVEVMCQIRGSARMMPDLASIRGGVPAETDTGLAGKRSSTFLSALAIADSEKGRVNRENANRVE